MAWGDSATAWGQGHRRTPAPMPDGRAGSACDGDVSVHPSGHGRRFPETPPQGSLALPGRLCCGVSGAGVRAACPSFGPGEPAALLNSVRLFLLPSRYSLYNQPIVLWATAAGWSVSGSSVISVPLKAFGGLFIFFLLFFFFSSEEDSNANKG